MIDNNLERLIKHKIDLKKLFESSIALHKIETYLEYHKDSTEMRVVAN